MALTGHHPRCCCSACAFRRKRAERIAACKPLVNGRYIFKPKPDHPWRRRLA